MGPYGSGVPWGARRKAPHASFSINDWTVLIIFIEVISGIGSLEGPILGAALFFILREYLSNVGTWGLLRRALGGNLIPVSHAASGEFVRRSKT
jgi:branched-chain amino acid transport system permease protein